MKIKLFTIVICFLSVSAYAQVDVTQMAAIKGEGVNLRQGPGIRYNAIWKYGNGLPVKIIGKKNDWVRVTDFEGQSGWVFESLLEKKKNVIIKTSKNSKIKINIRKAPSIDAAIIAQAYHGVIFTLVEEQEDWLKVVYRTGLQGWVNKRFVWGY